jgi:hypothetical protein
MQSGLQVKLRNFVGLTLLPPPELAGEHAPKPPTIPADSTCHPKAHYKIYMKINYLIKSFQESLERDKKYLKISVHKIMN